MSGVETAASIAFQLSSAVNSPGESAIPDAQNYSVTHVLEKPVWVMPLFFPANPFVDVLKGDKQEKKANRSPDFLPVDLVVYNLAGRPPGRLQNTSGHITPEAAVMTHSFMETYIGNPHPELGDLQITDSVRTTPPLLACSDHYTEFVRHNKIWLLQGRVEQCDSGKPNAMLIKNQNSTCCVPNIAAVVCATGFDAAASLDFLPNEILQALQYDPDDDTIPLALNCQATVSKKFPSLGFVGFYRSPYWGVMEMQARFLGKLWSGDEKVEQALADDMTLQTMMSLRKDPRRAQFPMGDYAYLMEYFSEILGIKRFEPGGNETNLSVRHCVLYILTLTGYSNRLLSKLLWDMAMLKYI